jgi:hypothetical protein
MFKALRITILLVILATVAQEAWLARSRAVSWRDPLRVAIYPVNGDGSAAAAAYAGSLKAEDFAGIEQFFADEVQRHGRPLSRPMTIAVAAPLAAQPPQPPRAAGRFDSLLWSLQMRYYAWRHDHIAGMKPQVRLFVRYFDPADHARLPHSVGVGQGMIGLISAFASREMAGSNAVVITHELLHTLGATDKYDPATGLPAYPDGYAEPGREPRHPQDFAEIMGGRIPVSDTRADIPERLAQTLVGPATAAEIGWTGTP